MMFENPGLNGLYAPIIISVISTFASIGTVRGADSVKNIVGPNACAECHKHETEVWKKTHHFKTFRNMPRSKKATEIAKKMKIKRLKTNKLCQGCHFTLQKVKKRVKAVAGISCESCHASGKGYLKIHAEFSGQKNKKDETGAQAASRWKKSESHGMIRPKAIYKLAKNCFGCHVVPREKLVNIGGHTAGSEFELVSWSQGEVRHNLWYSQGKSNKQASQARRRIMYIIGIAIDLETALRSIAGAKSRNKYAFKMAGRAAKARTRMAAVAKAAPNIDEVSAIAKFGNSTGLKLDNARALIAAADNISMEALKLLSNHKGEKLESIDKLIPPSTKYKGTPAK